MNRVERYRLAREVPLAVRHLRCDVEQRVGGHRVFLALALPERAASDGEVELGVGCPSVRRKSPVHGVLEHDESPVGHGHTLGASR